MCGKQSVGRQGRKRGEPDKKVVTIRVRDKGGWEGLGW